VVYIKQGGFPREIGYGCSSQNYWPPEMKVALVAANENAEKASKKPGKTDNVLAIASDVSKHLRMKKSRQLRRFW